MRLNQYLAKSGISSRRKSEKTIKAKRVTVNDKCIDKPYYQVENDDVVKLDNKKIKPAENIYILINKPKGVTATCFDKFAETTVLDLVPKSVFNRGGNSGKKRIYPIGRLDKNSTGLMILTNDGGLCHKVTHPKFETEKEYLVRFSKYLKKQDLKKAKIGVIDKSHTKAGRAPELLKVKEIKEVKNKKHAQLPPAFRIIISEGKKRHLRRLFKQLGYTVVFLKRIRIGSLRLNGLDRGDFKFISSSKIKKHLNING